MLTHPTVDKLHQLRCAGMAKALAEQLGSPEIAALSFEERLGLIVDRELTERHSRQLTNRLRRARLRHPLASRTSTSANPAASTATSCSRSPTGAGSVTVSMSSSPDRPVWERPGLLALSPTARAAMDTAPRTDASLDC